jgi:hypothetical protein
LSLLVVTIGILSYTAAMDSLLNHTFVGRFDDRAGIYFSETLKRAVFTFAITRGINGVISVIQDTEIAFSPAGIGVTLAVGEILDPINDLIERFSWVMLVSTASLGIQKILLEVGRWFGFRLLLTLAMIILLAGIWFGEITGFRLLALGYRLVIIALIIRFCIPALAIASDKIYDLFLKESYIESTQNLKDIKGEIKESNLLKKDIKEEPSGFWGDLKSMYKATKETVDIKKKLDFLKDKVSNAVNYIIDLIVVFLLQTIIIPLLVLWALIKLSGHFLTRDTTGRIEKKFKDLLGRAGPRPPTSDTA